MAEKPSPTEIATSLAHHYHKTRLSGGIMIPADLVWAAMEALRAIPQPEPVMLTVPCDCTAATKCPQGRTGTASRCAVPIRRETLLTLHHETFD